MLDEIFYINRVSLVMFGLVSFIAIIIIQFSKVYMEGDRNYSKFLNNLKLLCCSVLITVVANHFMVFIIFWSLSNFYLVKLMIHKPEWKASKASGILAAKNFLISSLSIGLGMYLLYLATGKTNIYEVNKAEILNTNFELAGLALIFIGAVAQSAIWPFHKWLLSSLNSPTSVSAIMHAGLINGGGFVIIRFAPLYLKNEIFLESMFILGLLSSILGTFWKLLQSDYKRMLASSTMAQMGFMILQCGLGLFSAAMAHICLHGLFKAYLFLLAGSASNENRIIFHQDKIRLDAFILSIVCGVFGSYIFSYVSHKPWLANNTNLILVLIAFIASSQIAIVTLRNKPYKYLLAAIISTILFGALYGSSVSLIGLFLGPDNLSVPQPLNNIHILGAIIFIFAWLVVNLSNNLKQVQAIKNLYDFVYVKGLNSSQPSPSTITAHHNHYKY